MERSASYGEKQSKFKSNKGKGSQSTAMLLRNNSNKSKKLDNMPYYNIMGDQRGQGLMPQNYYLGSGLINNNSEASLEYRGNK